MRGGAEDACQLAAKRVGVGDRAALVKGPGCFNRAGQKRN